MEWVEQHSTSQHRVPSALQQRHLGMLAAVGAWQHGSAAPPNQFRGQVLGRNIKPRMHIDLAILHAMSAIAVCTHPTVMHNRQRKKRLPSHAP